MHLPNKPLLEITNEERVEKMPVRSNQNALLRVDKAIGSSAARFSESSSSETSEDDEEFRARLRRMRNEYALCRNI